MIIVKTRKNEYAICESREELFQNLPDELTASSRVLYIIGPEKGKNYIVDDDSELKLKPGALLTSVKYSAEHSRYQVVRYVENGSEVSEYLTLRAAVEAEEELHYLHNTRVSSEHSCDVVGQEIYDRRHDRCPVCQQTINYYPSIAELARHEWLAYFQKGVRDQ